MLTKFTTTSLNSMQKHVTIDMRIYNMTEGLALVNPLQENPFPHVGVSRTDDFNNVLQSKMGGKIGKIRLNLDANFEHRYHDLGFYYNGKKYTYLHSFSPFQFQNSMLDIEFGGIVEGNTWQDLDLKFEVPMLSTIRITYFIEQDSEEKVWCKSEEVLKLPKKELCIRIENNSRDWKEINILAETYHDSRLKDTAETYKYESYYKEYLLTRVHTLKSDVPIGKKAVTFTKFRLFSTKTTQLHQMFNINGACIKPAIYMDAQQYQPNVLDVVMPTNLVLGQQFEVEMESHSNLTVLFYD